MATDYEFRGTIKGAPDGGPWQDWVKGDMENLLIHQLGALDIEVTFRKTNDRTGRKKGDKK